MCIILICSSIVYSNIISASFIYFYVYINTIECNVTYILLTFVLLHEFK